MKAIAVMGPLVLFRLEPFPAQTSSLSETHSMQPRIEPGSPALLQPLVGTLEKLKKPLGSALEQGKESLRSRDVRDLGS
jgi:hypothetical protein